MRHPVRFWILLIILSLTFAACAGDDEETADPTATGTVSTPTTDVDETTPTAADVDPTATVEPAATLEPTVEPTAEPTLEPTTEPTADGDTDLPDTPAGEHLAWVIESLNAEDPITEDEFNERFTEQFINMVPLVQIIAGMAQIANEYGPVSFDEFMEPPTDTRIVARLNTSTEEAILVAIMTEPEEPHRIDFLQLFPESAADTTPQDLGSWAEFEALIMEQAPQVSFHAAEVDPEGAQQPIHTINPEERLAIGSAFKLYILGELARQIEEGTLSWDDELAIRDEWKSLPSGTMQDEPAGTTFTLREYAEQMISISDNTATDHLLFHLGRENVEAFQAEMGHGEPEVNMPMLSTREMFILKLVFDEQQQEEFIAASTEEQRQILETEVSQLDVSIEDALDWTAPREIDDIEWFASTTELSEAMITLREMSEREGLEPVADILSINPGLQLDPQTWTWIGFKGGSEPGVLSLNWLLERQDGRWFTLSVTLNDSTNLIDETAVLRIVGGAAQLLAETP